MQSTTSSIKVLKPGTNLRCETTRQNFELVGMIGNIMYLATDYSEGYAAKYHTSEFAGSFLMISHDVGNVYNLVNLDGSWNFTYQCDKDFEYPDVNENIVYFKKST